MSKALKLLGVPLSGIAVVLGEVLTAAHRPDLPSLENQDPSGVFGDPAAPPLRIVALGDSSITAPGVEPLDACWVRRLALHAADRWRVELLSVAVGGAKTRDVLADQVDRAIRLVPDIAIVSVGANDALRATPLARFEDELNQIIAAIHDVAAGVLLGGVGDLGTIPRLPTIARTYARVRGRSYDRAIARTAARYPNVHKTITWGPLWEPFERPETSGVFAPDLFHASAEGHRIFAEAALPAFERILGQLDVSAEPRSRESSK